MRNAGWTMWAGNAEKMYKLFWQTPSPNNAQNALAPDVEFGGAREDRSRLRGEAIDARVVKLGPEGRVWAFEITFGGVVLSFNQLECYRKAFFSRGIVPYSKGDATVTTADVFAVSEFMMVNGYRLLRGREREIIQRANAASGKWKMSDRQVSRADWWFAPRAQPSEALPSQAPQLVLPPPLAASASAAASSSEAPRSASLPSQVPRFEKPVAAVRSGPLVLPPARVLPSIEVLEARSAVCEMPEGRIREDARRVVLPVPEHLSPAAPQQLPPARKFTDFPAPVPLSSLIAPRQLPQPRAAFLKANERLTAPQQQRSEEAASFYDTSTEDESDERDYDTSTEDESDGSQHSQQNTESSASDAEFPVESVLEHSFLPGGKIQFRFKMAGVPLEDHLPRTSDRAWQPWSEGNRDTAAVHEYLKQQKIMIDYRTGRQVTAQTQARARRRRRYDATSFASFVSKHRAATRRQKRERLDGEEEQPPAKAARREEETESRQPNGEPWPAKPFLIVLCSVPECEEREIEYV